MKKAIRGAIKHRRVVSKVAKSSVVKRVAKAVMSSKPVKRAVKKLVRRGF